jgi:hypothetical protein
MTRAQIFIAFLKKEIIILIKLNTQRHNPDDYDQQDTAYGIRNTEYGHELIFLKVFS